MMRKKSKKAHSGNATKYVKSRITVLKNNWSLWFTVYGYVLVAILEFGDIGKN